MDHEGWLDYYNDGEKRHLKIGRLNFWMRYKSAQDGITPYRCFSVFVPGTYFGLNPHTHHTKFFTAFGLHFELLSCASNGISPIVIAEAKPE